MHTLRAHIFRIRVCMKTAGFHFSDFDGSAAAAVTTAAALELRCAELIISSAVLLLSFSL